MSVYRRQYRTNNHLEAYHKHIMRHMGGGTHGGAFPNAWIFLSKMEHAFITANYFKQEIELLFMII